MPAESFGEGDGRGIDGYSQLDVELLARLIACEGGTSREEQEAIGSVAINRVHSAAFANTITDVIFSPGRYACTWNGAWARRQVNDLQYEIAEDLLKTDQKSLVTLFIRHNLSRGQEYGELLAAIIFAINRWIISYLWYMKSYTILKCLYSKGY